MKKKVVARRRSGHEASVRIIKTAPAPRNQGRTCFHLMFYNDPSCATAFYPALAGLLVPRFIRRGREDYDRARNIGWDQPSCELLATADCAHA